MFVVVCITGPVLGIIIGGSIVSRFAGGYEGKHSYTFSFIFSLCAVASALPIRFIDSLFGFGFCLWSVLFFGGAVIPNVQGIMISSLDNDLRAAGNSVSNILQNLFGFLPSPLIYGIIYDRTKNTDPKCAMTVTLLYSLVGVGFFSFGMYYRMKTWKQNSINDTNDCTKEQVIEFDRPDISKSVVIKRISNSMADNK